MMNEKRRMSFQGRDAGAFFALFSHSHRGFSPVAPRPHETENRLNGFSLFHPPGHRAKAAV
jgi:hypothetical protein